MDVAPRPLKIVLFCNATHNPTRRGGKVLLEYAFGEEGLIIEVLPSYNRLQNSIPISTTLDFIVTMKKEYVESKEIFKGFVTSGAILNNSEVEDQIKVYEAYQFTNDNSIYPAEYWSKHLAILSYANLIVNEQYVLLCGVAFVTEVTLMDLWFVRLQLMLFKVMNC
ncbi:hypothetical protein FF38_03029 [Lucilia cuprina]|uniref:Uncharacterized protein n=1 Tax=Lucilia cuprina TaxID=7375 RepID=A0A0L0CBT5_LUCCU|nr:hypothetical protein FF38_03029 [Lucilia cuprina]